MFWFLRLPSFVPALTVVEDFKKRFCCSDSVPPCSRQEIARGNTKRLAGNDLNDSLSLLDAGFNAFSHWITEQTADVSQTVVSERAATISRGLFLNGIAQEIRDNCPDGPVYIARAPAKFMKKYRFIDGDEKVQKLGEGGFGSVVRCVHRTTGAYKAAKFVDGSQAQGLRAWRRIESHPNIVSLVDYFSSGVSDEKVAVMDICHGVDACEWLEQNGTMSEDECSHIFRHMVRACSHVHACGVLHRDLKLENFIFNNPSLELTDMDDLRLCDFDMARPMDEADEFEPGTVQGTPAYMAPEVFNGGATSTASDVYSLGVSLFILLTLHFPFSADRPREPNFKLLDKFSEDAQDLVRGMLRENPEERYTLHDVASHSFLQKSWSEGQLRPQLQRRDSLTHVAHVFLQERQLSPQQVLFREGDTGQDIFIVDQGCVEVWRDGVCTAQVHAGDIVGEQSFLNKPHRRNATILAGAEGATLQMLSADMADKILGEKSSITALRSLVQLSCQRDTYSKTLKFFMSTYPRLDSAFMVELVSSLSQEEPRRVEEAEAILSADNHCISRKIFYVRTGELSVYHRGTFLFRVPAGSFIAKPSVMERFGAPIAFNDADIEIIANQETEIAELPLHVMIRLQHKHAAAYPLFLQEAKLRWLTTPAVPVVEEASS